MPLPFCVGGAVPAIHQLTGTVLIDACGFSESRVAPRLSAGCLAPFAFGNDGASTKIRNCVTISSL
jgi:hypothetical protein